ncbi:MAG TPA: flagellar biosynthetic protein FliO [Candidatus Acidoferrales bacterium]|nr:flagellar biosynthetic protein FliO [Candidatus Acidoferrales bacterium]
MFRELIARLTAWCSRRPTRLMRVACVQPLAGGVTLYAIDIDDRRIVIGACAGSIRVLDRYPLASLQTHPERERAPLAPKS